MKILCAILLFVIFGDQVALISGSSDTPMPDVERCRLALSPSASPASPIKLTTLAYIVGVGWDNLRNTPMSSIYNVSFKECKTTPDSTYLLPDGLSALPVQKSELDRLATYYETYHDYFRSVTDSINLEANVVFGTGSISGKYSETHETIKQRSAGQNSSIFRSRLRYHAYTLIGPLDSGLYPPYKNRLINIGKAIMSNNTRTAKYLAQVVIRDHGTHVITRAEVGAEVSQDDYVDMTSVTQKHTLKEDMKASASASFFKVLGFNMNISSAQFSTGRAVTETEIDQFFSSVRHSQVNTKGGPNINRLVTSTGGGNKGGGVDLLIENIVALDHWGEPLYYTATPDNIPELPPWVVWLVALYLKNATEEYYVRNTHYGCTDQSAENFDINANVDDGNCRRPFHNYTFGGLYQTCLSDEWNSECDRANQRNGITGTYSCPSPYLTVKLLETRQYYTCCYSVGWWIFARDRCRRCNQQLISFWCKAIKSIKMPIGSGYMFGGMYSMSQANPFTGSATCPGRFFGVRLSFDVTICLSRDYDADQQFAIRLGHFFSCQSPETEARCPSGYSQHLATILDGCEVYFCIRPERDDQPNIMQAHRPPYGEFPFWDNMMDIEKATVHTNNNGLSGGDIASIVLGSVILLTIVFVVVYFMRKRKQNHENLGSLGERQLTVQARDTALSYQATGVTNETV